MPEWEALKAGIPPPESNPLTRCGSMNAPIAAPASPPTSFHTGGGPWAVMNGPMRPNFALMERALQDIPNQLPAPPKAVLVVSGHWEEPKFTVSTAANPGMVYDYYGFPPETYQIRYPAPGSPAVAARVGELLTKAGWDVGADAGRGFDHGTFSMMQPIYPQAEVPVVQLALRDNLDPAEHYEAGSRARAAAR